MMTRDLAAEMRAALDAMTDSDIDELVHRHGIDRLDVGMGLVGVVRARLVDSLYEPDDEGRRAYVTPVLIDSAVSPEVARRTALVVSATSSIWWPGARRRQRGLPCELVRQSGWAFAARNTATLTRCQSTAARSAGCSMVAAGSFR